MRELVVAILVQCAVSCWREDVFGPAVHARWPEERIALDDVMCMKARTVWGDGAPLARFAAKVRDCEESSPLVLVAFGGSATCGRNTGRKDPDRLCKANGSYWVECTEETWPERLSALIAAARSAACGVSGSPRPIHVHNYCMSARGTDYALILSAMNRATREVLATSDLVVVETANNDPLINRDPHEGNEQVVVQRNVELLVRLLANLPSRPAQIWLHCAWLVLHPPFLQHVADSQRDVLRWYGVPQLNLAEMFGPMHAHVEWFRKHYINDVVHPGTFGHKVTASVVAHALWTAADTAIPSFLRSIEPAGYPTALPQPLWAKHDWLAAFEHGDRDRVYRLEFGSARGVPAIDLMAADTPIIASRFFDFGEDRPTKPGFVGLNSSAFFSARPAPLDAEPMAFSRYAVFLGHFVTHSGNPASFDLTVTCAGATFASETVSTHIIEHVSIWRTHGTFGTTGACSRPQDFVVTVAVSASAPGKIIVYDLGVIFYDAPGNGTKGGTA